MRLTESRLRSIIRSLIRESLEDDMTGHEDFNKDYADIMVETGTDHYDISPDYAYRVNHYDMILRALTGNDSRGDDYIAQAFKIINCQSSGLDLGEWFENNASKIIECLNRADVRKRRKFFGLMDAALNHG